MIIMIAKTISSAYTDIFTHFCSSILASKSVVNQFRHLNAKIEYIAAWMQIYELFIVMWSFKYINQNIFYSNLFKKRNNDL